MSKIFIALIIGLILAAAFISKGQANQEDTVLLEDEIIQVSTDDPEISSMLAKLSEQIRLVEDSAQIEVVKTEANSIEIHVKDQDIKDSSVQLIYVLMDNLLNPNQYAVEVVRDYQEKNSFLGTVASFVLYLSLIFIGNMVITSVSLEKTSKMLDLISYKVSALILIYGKCIAVFVYIVSLIVLAVLEVLVLSSFNVIDLAAITNLLKLENLNIGDWGILLLAFSVALIVFMQLYIITGLFITDSSQLQLSQLPITLLTFSCYAVALFSLMGSQYQFLVDFTQFIPFSFPFGVLLKLFVFNNLTLQFLCTGIFVSLIFIIITFWILKKYLLPKKMI
jgi:hypothetical protein